MIAKTDFENRGSNLELERNHSFGLTTGVTMRNFKVTFKTIERNSFQVTTFTVDFAHMNSSEAFISTITNPNISISTKKNELYSPHMRVLFYFKCY